MSRKDYEAIAAVLRAEHEFTTGGEDCMALTPDEASRRLTVLRHVAGCLALRLQEDNPRFDRDRFLKACGL